MRYKAGIALGAAAVMFFSVPVSADTAASAAKQEKTEAAAYDSETAREAWELANATYEINDSPNENADKWSSEFTDNGYEQLNCIINGDVYRQNSQGTYKMMYDYDSFIADHLDAVVGIKEINKEDESDADIETGKDADAETDVNNDNGAEDESSYQIVVALRGTDDLGDVIIDLGAFPNDENLHMGFGDQAKLLVSLGDEISFKIDGKTVTLEDAIKDMKSSDSKYSILVTGHSLGGAIADAFAGVYLPKEKVDASNITAYTFAAAPCSYNENTETDAAIYNIINIDDFVPYITKDTFFELNQIGENIIYTPTEAERKEWYGDSYVKGNTGYDYRISLATEMHDMGIYKNIINEYKNESPA